MPEFQSVSLTKIGSPYVVAAIEDVLEANSKAKVVGFEANGGFLLGFECQVGDLTLAPLLTRDCVLPMVATLAAAKRSKVTVAELVATLPAIYTAADRLVGMPTESSREFIASLIQSTELRTEFFAASRSEETINTVDGLRVTFEGGEVVHLRPSGNAPEFRCYAEAGTAARAAELVQCHLSKVSNELLGE